MALAARCTRAAPLQASNPRRGGSRAAAEGAAARPRRQGAGNRRRGGSGCTPVCGPRAPPASTSGADGSVELARSEGDGASGSTYGEGEALAMLRSQLFASVALPPHGERGGGLGAVVLAAEGKDAEVEGGSSDEGGEAQSEQGRAAPGGGHDDKDQNGRNKEYYAQMGDAIRALRADLPMIFDKEHPVDWDIYREDVGLIVNIETPPKLRTRLEGLDNYKVVWEWFRKTIRVFFRSPSVEVKRIWQPVDGIIMVRWTIWGTLRGMGANMQPAVQFEGSSEFKLDKDGLIYEHRIDNRAMSGRNGQRQPTWQLELARIAAPARTPTPTMWCEKADSPTALLLQLVKRAIAAAPRGTVAGSNN